MRQDCLRTFRISGGSFYFHQRALPFISNYKLHFQSGVFVKIVQLSPHLGEYIWNEVIASRYNSRIFNPLQTSGIPPTEILQNPMGSCPWLFRILPGLTLVLFRNLLPLIETRFRLHRSDHPNGRTSMQFLRLGIPESHPMNNFFKGVCIFLDILVLIVFIHLIIFGYHMLHI